MLGWVEEWLPQRPGEALLAGFVLSGYPAPLQLTGFMVEWLAPWQLGGVTLLQVPILAQIKGRCQASVWVCNPCFAG